MGNLFNTPDHTAEFDQNDIQTNKIMAMLAYLGILFFLPLVACPDSKFGRFHANQGLILFIIDVAIGIVCSILAFIPFVGWILSSLIGGLVGLCMLGLLIFGMINTYNGNAKQLPLIGGITIIK